MLLKCPKCAEDLIESEHEFKCVNGHNYDKAREGYVNLMLANQKHSKEPGDNVDSLLSRQRILSKGVYQPLAEALSDSIAHYLASGSAFLDAGCGTGYYLHQIAQQNDLDYYAVDIAKKGVAMCAKSNPFATCFVGSVFHLPLGDECLDGLMSVFCPYSGEEFNRIVKKGGYVWAVTPGKEHLYEIKELVYEEPYFNEEKEYQLPGFEQLEKNKVTYKLTLSNEDLLSLWRMTPYYHTTAASGNEKLEHIDNIEVTVDFVVMVYQKNE